MLKFMSYPLGLMSFFQRLCPGPFSLVSIVEMVWGSIGRIWERLQYEKNIAAGSVFEKVGTQEAWIKGRTVPNGR